MDFVQLTEMQCRDFEENGYLIVPQALDRATIDRLIEGGDRLMESFEYENYYAHRRHGLIQEEEAFASLITNPSTVPLIVQLLSPNIHITNTALIYKHPQAPETPDFRNWHRDVGVHLDLGHRALPPCRIEDRLLPDRLRRTQLWGDPFSSAKATTAASRCLSLRAKLTH